MQQVSSVLTTIKKSGQLTSTQETSDSRVPIFSEQERKLINYFFARIRTVYGPHEYDYWWSSRADEVAARQEWGERICQYTFNEIDAKFKFIKENNLAKADYLHPVNFILNCNKAPAPNHSPYVKIEYRPDYKEKGLIQIQKLKNLFNMQKQS